MPEPMTAAEYAKAQAVEWSTYVARTPIDYYGVRAYNAGDPVPASAIVGQSDGGWVPESLVEQISDDVPAFVGSTTVVDPAPPTIDATLVAAPLVTAPVVEPVVAPEAPSEPEASAPEQPATAAPVATTPAAPEPAPTAAAPAAEPAVETPTATAAPTTTPEV